MSRLSWTRWLVAGAVFLLIGWAMGRFGMNAARVALVLLLLLVYRYGGHGRPAQPEAGAAVGRGEPGAGAVGVVTEAEGRTGAGG